MKASGPRPQSSADSPLMETTNSLLDQSTIHLDAKAFQKILDWMEEASTPLEKEGMKRLERAGAILRRD